MDDAHDGGGIQQAEDQALVMHWAEEAERAERLRRHVGELQRTTFDSAPVASARRHSLPFGADGRTTVTLGWHSSHQLSVRRVLLTRGAISSPRVARFVARLLCPLTLRPGC